MSPDAIDTSHMFFFGTLMDSDILATVIGRLPPLTERQPAVLRGHRRVFVAGRAYPMLVPWSGGRVEGVLVLGLSDRDRERLAHYEGWEYITEPVSVRTLAGKLVETEMFAAASGVQADPRDWSLDVWQKRHKAQALAGAQVCMARLGRI